MARITLLFTALALSAKVHGYTVSRFHPGETGLLELENLPAAQYSTTLSQKVRRPSSKKNMRSYLLKSLATGSSYHAQLDGAGDDAEYVTEITIGGQNFKVIVDTGS